MIIVGTYPEIDGASHRGQLSSLKRVLEGLIPADVVLHLLPPYPSSGDGGFAPDDWYSVRAELGTWQDIVDWALTRRIVLDGVYNHVGLQHHFAKEFFASPSEGGPICAYQADRPPSAQLSPRGGSVFRQYTIAETIWQVWQTFSRASVDICLLNNRVFQEIKSHLDFLTASHIFGVRLDGCAYYGRDLDAEQFHNPKGRDIARVVARSALDRGLFTVAQLDTDPAGSSYFPKAEGWSVPVIDYAYSAVLVRTLLSESASAMALHVQRTNNLPCSLVRPPRTHDGILLQSDLLASEELNEIDEICDRWQLPVRSADGEKYEINSSLPYICSLGANEDQTWRRILMVILLTGFLPGVPYYYLPFAIGDVPERRATLKHEDPRSLNRARLSLAQLQRFQSSPRKADFRAALAAINNIQLDSNGGESDTPVRFEARGPLLVLKRQAAGYTFACNFSKGNAVHIEIAADSEVTWASGLCEQRLEPLGVAIWKAQDSQKSNAL